MRGLEYGEEPIGFAVKWLSLWAPRTSSWSGPHSRFPSATRDSPPSTTSRSLSWSKSSRTFASLAGTCSFTSGFLRRTSKRECKNLKNVAHLPSSRFHIQILRSATKYTRGLVIVGVGNPIARTRIYHQPRIAKAWSCVHCHVHTSMSVIDQQQRTANNTLPFTQH